jgi:hypothetical protein
MTKLRLIATFYKSYALVSWIISLFCLALIYMLGITFITPLFWFKVLTLVVMVLFINSYKHNEFYYYQHIVDVCDKLYLIQNGQSHLTKTQHELVSLGYVLEKDEG